MVSRLALYDALPLYFLNVRAAGIPRWFQKSPTSFQGIPKLTILRPLEPPRIIQRIPRLTLHCISFRRVITFKKDRLAQNSRAFGVSRDLFTNGGGLHDPGWPSSME